MKLDVFVIKMLAKRNKIILIVTFVLLFVIFYNFLDSKVESFLSEEKKVLVSRVIDGDTIETSEGETIRLLGINTPERGERYYSEAKAFLESLVLGKEVEIEFVGERQDKYYRTLGYVFLDSENVNVKVVENGYANYYFYSGKDKYSGDLENAWEKCIGVRLNLCEPSQNICSSCVSLERDFVMNYCSFSCDLNGWEVKDEGRDKIIFNEILESGDKVPFDLDLTSSGGSLFLKDNEGKLVSWEVY